ncbi:MAG: preprotein translocase subunit SecA [Proteobacteria bacterium]|nr:preprotein translocase subunit SecA [Pseudomonadota bacterium]
MLLEVARKIFGSKNARMLAKVAPVIKSINEFAPTIEAMSDSELKAQTNKFKKMLEEGISLDHILPEAYATVREAASRVLGERHYDTQLIGGFMLHKGYVTEMKTGEGKTLVATLPSYLNALTGKGVHVITVNDYLAKRDSQWMAQIFNFLGLSCSYVISGMETEEKRNAYNADILYATNNELGFDYLRDNMSYAKEQMVQRELNFAIVDEVDSILIDEARVPLIISGVAEDRTDLYSKANMIVPKLKAEVDFTVDEKSKNVALTDQGSKNVEKLLQQNGILEKSQGLYDVKSVDVVHHINIAITAHQLYKVDKDYIIKDGEIILIDDFTGRMGIGRRLSNGLHQAIEAKEKVKIQAESQTLASITYQNFFKLYDKLSGMTGTAMTEIDEFEQIYNLQVVEIPTFRKVQRLDDNDAIYQTKKGKFSVILEDVKECHKKDQPILIGAGSIENSEELSLLLQKNRIPHNVLNAKFHEQEAEIVAQAGRPGAITIATNMAGRGTDIKLGGNLELMLKDVENEAEKRLVEREYEQYKKAAQEAGGLRVISTQRNESRRIDNQLRGRSGRQGDIGSSKFYISLDDDLMRIFATNLKAIMTRLNVPEDEKLENVLVSKAIETAQRKIESFNFDSRKEVLKYDDVINNQRNVIYSQRKEILTGIDEDMKDITSGFIEDVIESLVVANSGKSKADWNFDALEEDVHRVLNIKADLKKLVNIKDTEKTIENILTKALKVYDEKAKRVGDELFRKVERDIFLHILDQHWRDHLKRLDFLRSTIHLRANAQKNPLNEYKSEAFDMFNQLLKSLTQEVVKFIMHVEVRKEDRQTSINKPVATKEKRDFEPPSSRNAPCPCGSGNRYKHCCGKL